MIKCLISNQIICFNLTILILKLINANEKVVIQFKYNGIRFLSYSDMKLINVQGHLRFTVKP